MFSPVRALRERDDVFETIVCSTGQHSSLLADALATFGLTADYALSSMRYDQRPDDVAWAIAPWITQLCRRLRPDAVLVQGDTTTTMAAGLAAFYSSTLVAHVEAGLRTYDNRAPWPEEAHRRILGAVADLHFAPSELAAANLRREGVAPDRVHVTGNTGIDALHWALSRPRPTPPPEDGQRRVVVTTHRRESIPDKVWAITRALRQLAQRFPDVRFQFVVHPNPSIERAVLTEFDGDRPANIEVLPPCDYVSFVHMLADSFFVITDSGGVQEEAPPLGKPVLVVNRRTARKEPVAAGTARIVGTSERDIVAAAARLLEDPAYYAQTAVPYSPYGDGHAGEQIAAVLASFVQVRRREAARAR